MLSNEIFKKTIEIIYEIDWKYHYLWSSDVAMTIHCCDISTYPQFYDQYLKPFQMLPRKYHNSYDGKNSDRINKNG